MLGAGKARPLLSCNEAQLWKTAAENKAQKDITQAHIRLEQAYKLGSAQKAPINGIVHHS